MADIDTVFDNTIKIYEQDLQKALRRKQRAEASLHRANRDIDLITGSLMAVQTMIRQLAEPSEEKENLGPQGPRPSDAEMVEAIAKAPTLAG